MKHQPFKEGKYYHLFNRGNNRENIFIENRNYSYFLDKVNYYLIPIANIFSYYLLPNHFHMVIQIKEGKNLPSEYQNGKKKLFQAFSNCFNPYSKSINKAYNRTGSLFQEHLHRVELNTEEYFRDTIIYVHLNPLNHEIFMDYYNYLYSSYRLFFDNKPTFIRRNEILELFDGIDNFKYCHEERRIINENKLEEIEQLDI